MPKEILNLEILNLEILIYARLGQRVGPNWQI